MPYEYDVFLSHNSKDKPAVEIIGKSLQQKHELKCWLDKWNLVPGEPWQEALEGALDQCETVAVFVGPNTISPWENEEMRSALEERVHDKTRRVIPVLLPGAPDSRDLKLPRFLKRLTWVDLRAGLDDEEALYRLFCGIRGIQPGERPERERDAGGGMPPGSYLPFARNALFTGRDADIEQLEKSLLDKNSSSILISQRISGMGGIGKTQLAVEFAYRYSHKFKGIHWLDLHDPAALDSQIAQCGVQMRLQPWSKELPEQVILTLAAWKADGLRLLILDNFEVPHEGGQVLSQLQAPNVRLLITSRRSDWPAALGIRPLPLEVFTEQESIEFLQKYTENRFSKEQLQALAERLGHLPLALELAGRYLEKHSRLTIEGYLSKLETALDHESMRGFRKDLPNPTQHDLDLLSTYSLSWKEIKDDTAQKLFLVAAYCAPNTPIPLEILEKTLDLDETACDGGLDILVGLGLLKENAIIHPLLADYARHLDPENLILAALTGKLAAIARERNAEVRRTGNYSLYSQLLPHVRSVAEQGEAAHIQSAGSLWNSLGYHIHDLADYAGARAAYERALKIDEAAFGPDHPNVARDINNLGLVLKDQGDLAGAKAAFERVLSILDKTLPADHPYVASTTSNLGMVLKDLGDLAGAKAAFERALKIDEAAFGPDHPNMAIRVNNLGSVLQALGDLAGARAAYERALKIHEAAFGPYHPNVARDINNLGSVLQALGDLAAAKAAYERALTIREKSFGKEHPDVAVTLWWLGVLARDEGNKEIARDYYERALQVYQKFLPPDHPDIKSLQNYLNSLE